MATNKIKLRPDQLHEALVKANKKPLLDRAKVELERLIGDGWALGKLVGTKKLGGRGRGRVPLSKLLFDYEHWYTEALPVVRQLIADRLAEFQDLYKSRERKELNASSYSISDYLSGIVVALKRGPGPVEPTFDHDAAFRQRLLTQIAILSSARARLGKVLPDLRQVAEAEVSRDELGAASSLLSAGHLRAAGAVAGVLLERYLKHLVAVQSIAVTKRNPSIGDLNEALRSGGIYDTPHWRKVQYFADVRTLCAHDKGREPTRQEVEELIQGVRAFLA